MHINEPTPAQIKKLHDIQSKKNGGRGISCAQEIIAYAEREDFRSAQIVRCTDGDKIKSYPDIEAYVSQIFGCRLHGVIGCSKLICSGR